MAGEIARDGISTWQWLCDAGGIEIRGRDADFAEALRVALRPSAPTLEDALRETSTDDFISAFFSVAEPFVTMFQAILQFFEAAGVPRRTRSVAYQYRGGATAWHQGGKKGHAYRACCRVADRPAPSKKLRDGGDAGAGGAEPSLYRISRAGATPGRVTGCAPRLTSGSDRVSACGQMRPWDTAHHVLCTKTFVARGCWPRTSLIIV